ncbi:hypothetical protein V1477_016901 [Vespula maculifrons]|uniref:Uncharacterized protein n=1 Tax=Vespula maculifrons TaxID=7453 RepID=A0ABD2B4H3_VESMC
MIPVVLVVDGDGTGTGASGGGGGGGGNGNGERGKDRGSLYLAKMYILSACNTYGIRAQRKRRRRMKEQDAEHVVAW